MEFDDLEILESKIIRALDKIESLKKDNQELRDFVDNLQSENEKHKIALEEMSEKLKLVEDQGLKKEETIKMKVSNLLDRLENL